MVKAIRNARQKGDYVTKSNTNNCDSIWTHTKNQSTGGLVDEAINQVGLPVTCGFGDCGVKGYVKPHSDYNGWYKSKLFRLKPSKRWFCPEHYEEGRAIDNRFYQNLQTPDPYPVKDTQEVVDKLYELLD